MDNERIVAEVCKAFNVTKKQLKSTSRKNKVVLAKMEICYLYKKLKCYSVAKISDLTGYQERMVYYYLNMLLTEVKYNPTFIQYHEVLRKSFKSKYNEEI